MSESLGPRNSLSKKDSVTSENPFLSLTLRQEIELQLLLQRGRVDTRRVEGRWDIERSSLPPGAKRELKLAFRHLFCKIRNGYSFTFTPGLQPATRPMHFQSYSVSLEKPPHGKWVGKAEGLRHGTVRADSEDNAWNMLIEQMLGSIRDDVRSGRRVTRYAMDVTDPVSKRELAKIWAAKKKLHEAMRLIRARKKAGESRASMAEPNGSYLRISPKRRHPSLQGQSALANTARSPLDCRCAVEKATPGVRVISFSGDECKGRQQIDIRYGVLVDSPATRRCHY